MNEISLILKTNALITIEEFKILDMYSHSEKIWLLIHKPCIFNPILIKTKTIEYVLEPEALTIFRIVSQNVLATWDTEITKNLHPNDEFNVRDSLFIRPYNRYH